MKADGQTQRCIDRYSRGGGKNRFTFESRFSLLAILFYDVVVDFVNRFFIES